MLQVSSLKANQGCAWIRSVFRFARLRDRVDDECGVGAMQLRSRECHTPELSSNYSQKRDWTAPLGSVVLSLWKWDPAHIESQRGTHAVPCFQHRSRVMQILNVTQHIHSPAQVELKYCACLRREPPPILITSP